MAKPTPTQDENDRAALGEHVVDKDYDRSGLDLDSVPPGAPLPTPPPDPEPEPKPEPEPEPEPE